MKSRSQIYRGEGERLLKLITTYHALQYEQVLQFFIRNRDSMKSLITSLIKRGRIYYDQDRNLLDFKEAVVYHTSGEFPVKLHFFSQDEVYEVIYVSLGQEVLINHVLASLPSKDANRLVILESEQQAAQITIDEITAFCLVTPEGTVNYYAKQKKRG